MEGRDKARDDKSVNFQQEYEMRDIAKQYLSLTWEKLRSMEREIKHHWYPEVELEKVTSKDLTHR